MAFTPKQYAQAIGCGIGAIVLVAAIASIPYCFPIGVLLLPGLLVAITFNPQGIHSDHVLLGLVVASVIDSALFAFAAITIMNRRKKTNLGKLAAHG